MGHLCGTIRAALVWLTALTTLVSGAPHLTCVCPDGRVTFFCLSAYPGLGTLCCGGAGRPADGTKQACCCAGQDGRSGGRTVVPPCCRAARRSPGAAPSHAESPGCHKTLTPSANFAAPAASADIHVAGGFDAAFFAPSLTASYSGAMLTSRDAPAPPGHKPGDLVFTLQRLLI